MTAQPMEAPHRPPVPHTMAGIRTLLPAEAQTQFDAEFAAVDLDDLAAVAKLRDAWWCRAAVATNPALIAGIESDEPLFPSPFR
jgi:hypothetical protein